jgi:hypothetical protein
LPPVVVSGEPNITPIFMRIWLMKITMQLVRLIDPVSLRMAWLIRRACTPDVRIAHIAFEFGLGRQRGDRIDHHHRHRTRPHQRIDDFQRLFAGIGLRDQQFVKVNAQLAGIERIKRMFGIHEGADPALFLFLGNGMQGQSGFARAFRAVNFDDSALGQTANAQRDIQPQRPGRGCLDLGHGVVGAKAHDGALPELAFDLGQR